MSDREFGIEATGQLWKAWPTDIARTAVAVIEKTRLEWVLRGNASVSSGETGVDRARFAHPLFRLALDAKSSRSGREQLFAPGPGAARSDNSLSEPMRCCPLVGFRPVD